MGFMIWALAGLVFVGIGLGSFRAKKAVGFWANMEAPQVTDIKSYNRAMGKLWIGFGLIFILLGLPLLAGQNSPLIFLSVLGVFAEIIGVMLIYTQIILPKYKK